MSIPARVYLAGPMRGYPRFNREAFELGARLLREKGGFIIVSPLEMDMELDNFDPDTGANLLLDKAGDVDIERYMARDLAALGTCDGVACLPGWQQSEGACREMRAAQEQGLPLLSLSFGPGDVAELRPIDVELLPWAFQRSVVGVQGPDRAAAEQNRVANRMLRAESRLAEIATVDMETLLDTAKKMPMPWQKLLDLVLDTRLTKAQGGREPSPAYDEYGHYDYPGEDGPVAPAGEAGAVGPVGPGPCPVGPAGPVRADGEVRVVDPKTGGAKGSKLCRPDLLPAGPLMSVATHFGKGCAKYSSRNWERGYAWSLSYAAMMRHALQFWNGEDIDQETQSPHMAAVCFHALALMEFAKTHPELDDRPTTLQREKKPC
jgi:hypothetical protein